MRVQSDVGLQVGVLVVVGPWASPTFEGDRFAHRGDRRAMREAASPWIASSWSAHRWRGCGHASHCGRWLHGHDHADRRRAASAVRPAAAQQGVAERRVGTGAHPVAQARGARRAWSSTCGSASRAAALDVASRTVTLESGEVVAADGVIIATGSAPRPLPGQPDLDGVTMLRTLDDSLGVASSLGGSASCRRDRCRLHRPRGCRDRGAERAAR